MKYLRIDSGEGEFLQDKDTQEYKQISEMVSNDILDLLIIMSEDDDIQFDEDISLIKNAVTKIVYENLLSRFKDFVERKDAIKSEIDAKYKPLEEKYL